MAQVQASLQIEIRYLKAALVASQEKADEYAQLGAFDHHLIGESN